MALQYIGAAAQLFQTGGIHPAHGGAAIIEVDYAIEGSTVVEWWQDNFAGWLRRREVSTDAAVAAWTETPTGGVGMTHRFGCITQKVGGYYYSFGIKNWPTMDVYAWKSADGITWTQINGGAAVLTHDSSGSSPWFNIWNVSVEVDGSGVFHLVAECAPSGTAQAGCGLGYAFATLTGDSISFDANKSSAQVVPYGGNPWLKYIPERNAMLCVHGMIYDPTPQITNTTNFWYLCASTVSTSANLSNAANWTTWRANFSIGESGIHVADPSGIALPSGKDRSLLLSYSYNQAQLYTDFADVTMAAFYDTLTAGAGSSFGDTNSVMVVKDNSDNRAYLGMSPAQVQSQVQNETCLFGYDEGAANALVVNLKPVKTALHTGIPICARAAFANTGASTINVNGLGATAIKKKNGLALASGDIAGAGHWLSLIYDEVSNVFVLLNPAT